MRPIFANDSGSVFVTKRRGLGGGSGLGGGIRLRFCSSLQSAALGHFQGSVKSFLGTSTGWMAIPQLLGSQARRKLREELLKQEGNSLGGLRNLSIIFLNAKYYMHPL